LRLCERFGFASVSFDGGDALPPEARAKRLARMSRLLERAADKMGVPENAMGMESKARLRVMAPEHGLLTGVGGSLQVANKIATLDADRRQLGSAIHEWAHMLDGRLAQMLKERLVDSTDLPEADKQAAMGKELFSDMPSSAQKLWPEVREGFAKVLGSVQSDEVLPGGRVVAGDARAMSTSEDFDRLEREQSARLEKLGADLGTRLAQSLGFAGIEPGEERIFGQIFALRSVRGAVMLASLGQRPLPGDHEGGFRDKSDPRHWMADFQNALLLASGQPDSARLLDRMYGSAKRSCPTLPREEFGQNLLEALGGMERESGLGMLAAAAWETESGFKANAKSAFGQSVLASRRELARGHAAYMGQTAEMFARAVGRGDDLEKAAMAIDYQAPTRDAKQNDQFAEGWSMLANAAGFGQARWKMSRIEKIEASVARSGLDLKRAFISVNQWTGLPALRLVGAGEELLMKLGKRRGKPCEPIPPKGPSPN
jgi:hypothetical protein